MLFKHLFLDIDMPVLIPNILNYLLVCLVFGPKNFREIDVPDRGVSALFSASTCLIHTLHPMSP